jgi:integration host factor subunit alpha
MTLTKSQIIDAIAEQNGFTKKKSSETVDTILGLIKSELASGEEVLISGFDKFCVKEKRERRGERESGDRKGYDPGAEEGCDFQMFG